MKKTLLTILISGIIFTSIGATAAYVYTARDINYQPSDENWNVENVQEALTELKTDVNNINNKVEGIERVYKAGEVELVALVSDDSFYKDSNGKYVLANSDTGRTLLADTSTYKSLSSTDDCLGIFDVDTVIPFSTEINTLELLGKKINNHIVDPTTITDTATANSGNYTILLIVHYYGNHDNVTSVTNTNISGATVLYSDVVSNMYGYTKISLVRCNKNTDITASTTVKNTKTAYWCAGASIYGVS